MPKKRKLSEGPNEASPEIEEKNRYVKKPRLTDSLNCLVADKTEKRLPKKLKRSLEKVIPCLPSSKSKDPTPPNSSTPSSTPPSDPPTSSSPLPNSLEYLLGLLKQCTNQVETRGLETKEIYRASGKVRKENELMKKCGGEENINLVGEDIHDICRFFKRLIREIKLIPTDRWTLFVDASRSNSMERAVNGLAPFKLRCMALLIPHLKMISGYEATTNMGQEYLAIVFAPTVVGDSPAVEENPTLDETPEQLEVMKSLLTCSIDWERFL